MTHQSITQEDHRYQLHPWHGISLGVNAPYIVTCFIECVPGDTMKYEIDKRSGYLMIDRPHRFSSICPTLYGFIPRTYCGQRIAQRCRNDYLKINHNSDRGDLSEMTQAIQGDGDPLDICVLSTRRVTHGNLLCRARPIAGLRMLDSGEADDKIIAVLDGDPIMQQWNDVGDLPNSLLLMIKHYFLSYKQNPDQTECPISILNVYNGEEARRTIIDAVHDYDHLMNTSIHQSIHN